MMLTEVCSKCHQVYGFDPDVVVFKKFLFWTICYKVRRKCPYCGHKPKYR